MRGQSDSAAGAAEPGGSKVGEGSPRYFAGVRPKGARKRKRFSIAAPLPVSVTVTTSSTGCASSSRSIETEIGMRVSSSEGSLVGWRRPLRGARLPDNGAEQPP